MTFSKKLFIITGLLSVVIMMAMAPPEPKDEKFKNLKVLPKDISGKLLDHVMDEWSASLGVRCGFCHARNEETKKMDWASDAKPEKEMARDMYKMTAMLNKKYFQAKKDSIGMMMETGVNCNTCHKGTAHPEVTVPEHHHGPGGPPPAAGSMPNGGMGSNPPQGTPPPSGGIPTPSNPK